VTSATPVAWRELEVARPDLVASDLDGTLLTPELELSPALPGALRALAGAGVVFAICTGRMFTSARAVAVRMGVREGLVICYQGAMVADLADGAVLCHTRMRPDDAAAVVRHLRVLGRHVNAYIDDEMYVDEVDEWALHYTQHTGVELHQVDDLEAEVLRRPPTKLVAITDADDATRILPDLQARWRDRLFVERSQPEYVEFAAGGVSKSGALQWLCERLGLPRERTVACGDGDNDRDMLRWAGLGVAMAEAAPEVRAAADVVVPRAELPSFFVRLAAAPAGMPSVGEQPRRAEPLGESPAVA
jgi:Cof subfamily protein (haloacid dehalogenase superfamily)